LFAVWGQNDSLALQSPSLWKTYEPVPVAPFYDTLFYINAGVGTFTPQERAVAITEKIRKVNKEQGSFHTDSLTILSEGGWVYITYRDLIIMSVTETDAKLNGKTQTALTLEYEKIITDAIIEHQKNMGWLTILRRVFLVLLIVVVQYLLIRIVNHLFSRISTKIRQMKGEKIKTIRFKSYVLMDEKKTTGFIIFLVRILRIFIILLMLYLSIPMALSVFPATRGLANILFGYVLTPFSVIFSSIIEFIPDLIAIVVIIMVFKYLIKGLRFAADEIHKGRLTLKGFYPDWAYPTFNIIRILLYAFMFVVLFNHLPYHNSDVFKGVSVFVGIIFSLGSSSIISNVVSGLVLTYMRPFKVGDRIKIGDMVGNVMEKTPFVTRIRTPKNEEITIPNSSIMSAQTFNYSHSARTYGLILHTELTFGYETPWRQVHELLLEVAKRTPNVLENPKPFILQTALNDFYAEYQLNVYVVDADKMAQIYSDLHQNVQDVFHEASIEITSPHYQAHRDGSHSTIPSSYLPADYQAPPFRVQVEK
jgi:small-conductance mechanosensitive channel